MVTVDILSPVGGRAGGIENVIRSWTRNLDGDDFSVRVVHMAPGMKYLEGYNKTYAFEECNEKDFNAKLTHFARNYAGFVQNYGSPDVCVATNWPSMCVVADAVKRLLSTDFRIFSWVHSRIAEYEEAGLGGVEQMLVADAHLCISRNNERAILSRQPDAKTFLVGNPVVMQELVEEAPDNNTLCYVGRLQDVKRVDIILEALYRAKHKWKLKIVGSGESEEELKEIVAYLKQQEQVEFLGWQEKPWECCKDATVFVAASDYEGFMLTGAEALSMGMTVISTPVEGLIDYLKPGVNGYLFEKEDAKGLAEILDYIYEGVLPLCDRRVCRNSVEQYSEKNYFDNVRRIMRRGL